MAKRSYQLTGDDLELAPDPDVMLALAIAADHGWRGVERNPARAFALLRRAAELGNGRAARLVGDRCFRGLGIERDEAEAHRWYLRAANAGDVDAMANLIPLLDSKVASELAEGERWLVEAARHGQPYAVSTLKALAAKKSKQNQKTTKLATLAKEILASLPAGADELARSFVVRGDITQINDLAGTYLDRLAAKWPRLAASAECSGDPRDFPAPQPPAVEDGDTVTLTIKTTTRHLQLDLTPDGARWSITITSFEPHPTTDEQTWLVSNLEAAARALTLELERA